MNNPNDIVQNKHLEAAVQASKDFFDNNCVFVDNSGTSPTVKLNHGGKIYTIGQPVSSTVPDASLSGNVVTCGNDSFTLSGFADLTLQGSKFFDSNNNQVGSLTFNITDCCYDFNFSSDALNPNLQSGDTISVNSDAPCRLSCSAFPDNNSWYEMTDNDIATVIGSQSFTIYQYKIDETINPYIKQTATNQLEYKNVSSSATGLFMVSDFLIAGQVVGLSSGSNDDWGNYRIGSLSSNPVFWLEGYSDDEGKLGKTLVVTNAAFGLSAGASLANLKDYFDGSVATTWNIPSIPYQLNFTYSDNDNDDTRGCW